MAIAHLGARFPACDEGWPVRSRGSWCAAGGGRADGACGVEPVDSACCGLDELGNQGTGRIGEQRLSQIRVPFVIGYTTRITPGSAVGMV